MSLTPQGTPCHSPHPPPSVEYHGHLWGTLRHWVEGPALGDMEVEAILPSTQSMRLLASDLQRMDIAQLDPEALGNIKKLSVSLVTLRAQDAANGVLSLAVLGTVFWGLGFIFSTLLSSFPQGIITVILLP